MVRVHINNLRHFGARVVLAATHDSLILVISACLGASCPGTMTRKDYLLKRISTGELIAVWIGIMIIAGVMNSHVPHSAASKIAGSQVVTAEP